MGEEKSDLKSEVIWNLKRAVSGVTVLMGLVSGFFAAQDCLISELKRSKKNKKDKQQRLTILKTRIDDFKEEG